MSAQPLITYRRDDLPRNDDDRATPANQITTVQVDFRIATDGRLYIVNSISPAYEWNETADDWVNQLNDENGPIDPTLHVHTPLDELLTYMQEQDLDDAADRDEAGDDGDLYPLQKLSKYKKIREQLQALIDNIDEMKYNKPM